MYLMKGKKEKLKDCPFCGGTGIVQYTYNGTWVVTCAKCKVMTPHKNEKGKAIEIWENRNEIRKDG